MQGRSMHIMNCDPAAEDLQYEPSIDIRDLISLDDVSDNLGPNGGLVYCFEHLTLNLEWLTEQLGDFTEDYLLIDMPGQIELYTHYKHLNKIITHLGDRGYRCCSLYLIDSRFLVDSSSFISASLMGMACQINLELPHFHAITKMDIVERDKTVRKRDLDKYLDPDEDFLLGQLSQSTTPKFRQLNHAMAELVSDFSLIRYHTISVHDPDSLQDLLMLMDNAIQWDEEREPKTFDEPEEGE